MDCPQDIWIEIVQRMDTLTTTVFYFVSSGCRDCVKRKILKKNKVCSLTASRGYLDLLKWCRMNGCPWDLRVCLYSANEGHLETLKWCMANIYPWNDSIYLTSECVSELSKWCNENGCPWNVNVCSFAASGGHLDVLKWCRYVGYSWHESTSRCAARGGNPEVIKYCIEYRCPGYEQLQK
jgi:hypothetical protein